MRQRTVDLTDPQIARLTFEANRRGISVPELLRRLVDQGLDAMGTPWPEHRQSTCPAPAEHLGEGDIGVRVLEGGGEEPGRTDSRKAESSGGRGRRARLSRVSPPPDAVLPFPVPDQPPPAPPDQQAEKRRREELRWRINACWADHLLCREGFYREANGSPPGVHPTLTDDIAKAIRDQLLAHDRDLLGPDDRELWRRESRVRAAGCGIFNDPWCAGRHPQNDASNGGTRYLEPWRPWKRLHGKPDPVPRFAQLYFEIRDAEEVAARAGRWT